jgi:uncharacterized protein
MFEWDEAKRLRNNERHGIGFADASLIFDGRPLITAPSFRNNEDRFVSTAEIDFYLYSVVLDVARTGPKTTTMPASSGSEAMSCSDRTAEAQG